MLEVGPRRGDQLAPSEGARPDYTVARGGLIIGHVELKAPGAGVDPDGFRGHDRAQWLQLRHLPNLLYTDGIDWILWQDGQSGLAGDCLDCTEVRGIAGARIDPAERWYDLLDAFCANASRVLRSPSSGTRRDDGSALPGAAQPDSQHAEYRRIGWACRRCRGLAFAAVPGGDERGVRRRICADHHFGLIAARAADADLDTGDSVADRVVRATRELGTEVGLIPTALRVLCSETAIRNIEPSVESLLSLLAATDRLS